MKTHKSLKSVIGDERTILIVCPDCEFEGLNIPRENVFVYDCLFHCLDGRSSHEATLIEHYIKALGYHQIAILAQNNCKAMADLATSQINALAEAGGHSTHEVFHEQQTEDLVLNHIRFLEEKEFMKRCQENMDVVIMGLIWDSTNKQLLQVH